MPTYTIHRTRAGHFVRRGALTVAGPYADRATATTARDAIAQAVTTMARAAATGTTPARIEANRANARKAGRPGSYYAAAWPHGREAAFGLRPKVEVTRFPTRATRDAFVEAYIREEGNIYAAEALPARHPEVARAIAGGYVRPAAI